MLHDTYILGIMKNKQTSAVVHSHPFVRSVGRLVGPLLVCLVDSAYIHTELWQQSFHSKPHWICYRRNLSTLGSSDMTLYSWEIFPFLCLRGGGGMRLWITNDTFVNQMEKRLVEESLSSSMVKTNILIGTHTHTHAQSLAKLSDARFKQ